MRPETPHATVTIGNGETGVGIGMGKLIVTIGSADCASEFEVKEKRVGGEISCGEVTGYNQADRSMGPVKVEVTFSATS